MEPDPWICPLPPPPPWPPPPPPPPSNPAPAPPRDGLAALTVGDGDGTNDGFHSLAAGLGFHSFAFALSADFFLSSEDATDDGAGGGAPRAVVAPAGDGVIAGVLLTDSEEDPVAGVRAGGVVTAFTAAAAGTNAGADLLLPLLEATAAAAAAAAEADVGFAEPATAVGVFGATVDWVAGLLAGGACDTTEGAAAALGEGAAAAAAAAAAAVGPFSPLGGGVDLQLEGRTLVNGCHARGHYSIRTPQPNVRTYIRRRERTYCRVHMLTLRKRHTHALACTSRTQILLKRSHTLLKSPHVFMGKVIQLKKYSHRQATYLLLYFVIKVKKCR